MTNDLTHDVVRCNDCGAVTTTRRVWTDTTTDRTTR
jgi:hypothetical protein